MTKQHNDYYTYAFLREDRTPYYIGKGRGRRIYRKNRTINAPTDKSRIIFLKKNLTEAEAFKHEVYMIFVLGRKDLGTGILRNRTNGGEGCSGAVHTEARKKAHSERMSGEKNPQFGVPHTEAQKKANSERNSGEKNPQYGRTGALCFNSKAITAIQPDGTQRHFVSGTEAARELGINNGNLSGRYLKPGYVPRGKWEGWRFLYENPAGVL